MKLYGALLAVLLAVVLLVFSAGCKLEIVQHDPEPSDIDRVWEALDYVIELIEDE